MYLRKLVAISLALTFLFGLTLHPAQAQVAKLPVDRTFLISTMTFENSRSELIYVFGSKEVSGRLAVCGAYWITGKSSTMKVIAREFLRQMSFSLDGKQINMSAFHFQKVASAPADSEILGMTSKCRLSNIAWQKAYAKNGVRVVSKRTTVTH